MNILLINGSCAGESGNTSLLLQKFADILPPKCAVSTICLADYNRESALDLIGKSNGFVFGTGTYWDSWGSPLQKFLEDVTETEGTDLWLGKPAAVIVSMHSVGGKGILSRLQGVLNTFGVLIPPMTGMVYSTVNQLALAGPESDLSQDLWCVDDLKVVAHNLVEACVGGKSWHTWPVDRKSFGSRWIEK